MSSQFILPPVFVCLGNCIVSPSTSRCVTLGACTLRSRWFIISYPGADRYPSAAGVGFLGYRRYLFQIGDCVSLPVFQPLLHRGGSCLLAGCKDSYSARDFPVPVPPVHRSQT